MEALSKTLRKPAWIRSIIPSGAHYKELYTLKEKFSVKTVCEEAKCPNLGECWKDKHLTLMILGEECTRNCYFCGVKKTNGGLPLDKEEPLRVAKALKKIKPAYCVLTSVTRDDLEDGGASIFFETVQEIKKIPDTLVEVLIPDFKGDLNSIRKVINSKPDVIGHNLETSRRMHSLVRPMSDYDISINVLKAIKKENPSIYTKSAFMVGLGEKDSEVFSMLLDLKKARVDIVNIGQYLSPGKKNLPVKRYVTPEKFSQFREFGKKEGIKVVESGPLVRSSYKAQQSYNSLIAST